MERSAKDYAKPLQCKLAEAGLQGALQAGAYKVLLQYVADIDGKLDVLYAVLDQLKASECSNHCMSRSAAPAEYEFSSWTRWASR
jgi:hypothetical protein